MLPPIAVGAPDQQPEQPIPGLEFRARPGSEGNPELVAQEQVLGQMVVLLPEESRQRGEEDAE
jgi:hypothetical protein